MSILRTAKAGLCILPLLMTGACGGDDAPRPAPPAPVATISIASVQANVDRLDIRDDQESYKIDLSITPGNASRKNLAFRSTNSNVVSIDKSGTLTTNGTGEAAIEVVDGARLLLSIPINVRPVRMYSIGNSHTIDYRPGTDFPVLAKSQSISIENSVHIKCSSSLTNIIENPGDSCGGATFPSYTQGLQEGEFDVITIQPHLGPTGIAEVESIIQLIGQIRQSPNRDAQVFIYYTWPRNTAMPRIAFDYSEFWAAPYDARNPIEGMNSDLVEYMREELARRDIRVAGFIPAGATLDNFHRAASDGAVAGFTGAGAFYRDRLHMNNVGSFAAGITVLYSLFPELEIDDFNVPGYGKTKKRDLAINANVRRSIAAIAREAVAAEATQGAE